jgi:hypothetical protein
VLGAQGSNLETAGSKPAGSADSPIAHWSPRRVPPSASRSYQDRPVVGPRGLLPLGYEDMEPPPGADPGHPPYEGGAAAVRGGEATGAGIEPAWPRFRALMGCQQPTRYQVGEAGFEPATARGLSSAALPVGRTRPCAERGSNPRPSD